jgi:hypothetical protein
LLADLSEERVADAEEEVGVGEVEEEEEEGEGFVFERSAEVVGLEPRPNPRADPKFVIRLLAEGLADSPRAELGALMEVWLDLVGMERER